MISGCELDQINKNIEGYLGKIAKVGEEGAQRNFLEKLGFETAMMCIHTNTQKEEGESLKLL